MYVCMYGSLSSIAYARSAAHEMTDISFKTKIKLSDICFHRLRELHTLKGKVESVAKLKGIDLEDVNNQHYTV